MVVLDSVVSDSRAPVLVYAFGVQSDSVRINYVLRDDEGDTLRIRLE